ncbi:MAG: DNA translocase FtsK 4TM domain-containing protein [Candidatus Pacebacteria bacterium]|nr:DNA translocase FtsK 4TM domain-containing protein [Candidatus Paceibacterota bacterium]
MAVERRPKSRKFLALPSANSVNYRRRLREFFGLVILLLALGLIAIAFMFNATSPSLFYAGPEKASWLSLTAATIAVGGQKLLGLSYFFTAGVMLFWGYRRIFNRNLSHLMLRLPALLVMIMLASMVLEWVTSGLGGWFGTSLAVNLVTTVSAGHYLVPIWLKLVVLCLWLIFLCLSLGFTRQEIRGQAARLGAAAKGFFFESQPKRPVKRKANIKPHQRPRSPVIGKTSAPIIASVPIDMTAAAIELPAEPVVTAEPPESFSDALAVAILSEPSDSFAPTTTAEAPPISVPVTKMAEPAVTDGKPNWWQKAGQTVLGKEQNRPWWRGDGSQLQPLQAQTGAVVTMAAPRVEGSEYTPSPSLLADPFTAPLPPEPVAVAATPPPTPVVDNSYGFEGQLPPLSPLVQQPFDPDAPLGEDDDMDDGAYRLPPTTLLNPPPPNARIEFDPVVFKARERQLEAVLGDFGVRGEIVKTRPGPIVTLYELDPAPGTKSSRVIGLADDIARSMSAHAVRIAVVPGRSVIGIELPNTNRELVVFREIAESDTYRNLDARLPLILGKDIGGSPIIVDLAKMPHLLIAGTTGSGKSVGINAMILSLLFRLTPEECRIIMIDPKMLELSVYDGIPHLLTPVVTEPKKAIVALKWVVREMENRYRLITRLGVRNIEAYNARIGELQGGGVSGKTTRRVQIGFDPRTGIPITEDQEIELQKLPKIVVIVDEMADLMLVAGKDIEASIQRLAQMARAAGIHLIMATQRPSVDVITGTIKANFPTRISFMVTSKIDSRTILGESGAEQLLGQGDMLYMAGGGRLTRVHGPFVSDLEVERVVEFLKGQAEPVYVEAVTDDEPDSPGLFGSGDDYGDKDELYDQALAIITRERRASTSYIQRHLQIGFNRAARIIDRMEAEGIVGPANHVGKREVLIGGKGESGMGDDFDSYS